MLDQIQQQNPTTPPAQPVPAGQPLPEYKPQTPQVEQNTVMRDSYEDRPMTAHESRALTMGLELEYDLPSGALQAINEHMTGYRKDNAMVPPHVERSASRMAEHVQAARRFHEKLNEFDGILPLAIDAYYRGDKATRASLDGGGFDSDAVDNIYATLARMPKYGGQEFTDNDYSVMASVLGHAPGDYSGVRNAPIPKPGRPLQIQKLQTGGYLYGDNFYNAMAVIESGDWRKPWLGGNTGRVSSTGAKGPFQFTKGTGRAYGLITADGRDLRDDPVASFAAVQRLTEDNARALRKAGYEPTPSLLYMAHQQGAGGTIELLKAAASGRDVSAKVRANMRVNGGAKMTPAQFINFFTEKFDNAYSYFAQQSGQSNVLPQEAVAGLPAAPEKSKQQQFDELMGSIPTEASLNVSDAGGYGTYADPTSVTDPTVETQDRLLARYAKLDSIFKPVEVNPVPLNVTNAIKGIVVSV